MTVINAFEKNDQIDQLKKNILIKIKDRDYFSPFRGSY
jgi:hypothetical protein